MSGHSKLAPSAAKRWLACPGSVALSENAPRPDSEHSLAGTAAHELAEMSLKGSKDPSALLGRTLSTRNMKGEKFVIDQDMVDNVTAHTDHVKSILKASKKPQLFIEATADMGWLIRESGGTSDVTVFDTETHILDIVDYKNGQGVIVEPERNEQLMIYGLGMAGDIAKAFGKGAAITEYIDLIRLHIVQPRAEHDEGPIRTWVISSRALMHWAHNVLVPGANRALSANAPLHIGDHCRWCPVLATCPKQTENALEIAKTDFNNPVFPDPKNLTPADLGKLLQFSEVFAMWVKSVKDHVFEEMQHGKQVEGWKLVAGRSNRQWSNPVEAEECLTNAVGRGKAFTVPKLISPAQAEKAFKTAKLDPKALASLIYKPDAGVSMARDTDKRKAVACSAVADFAEVPTAEAAAQLAKNSNTIFNALEVGAAKYDAKIKQREAEIDAMNANPDFLPDFLS